MSDACPLISVIMGVFYRKTDTFLLERAIRSMLDQTYDTFELLICPDGSSPQAMACLERFCSRDARIRLVHRSDKTDLASKLNACLAEARGEFIARMDDDDYCCPDRFEKQMDFLREHPDIDFVGCDMRLLRADLTPFGQQVFPERPVVKDFFMTQPFSHAALILRADALADIGGYSEDPSCDHCEDYDMLLRMYENGHQGANISECLYDYTFPNIKGNRNMHHRRNETVTRFRHFRKMGLLPRALPYVIKPLVVGIIPAGLMDRIKKKYRY